MTEAHRRERSPEGRRRKPANVRSRCLLLVLLTIGVGLLAGCTAVDPRIAERITWVDIDRITDHVDALTRHGPRPVHDADATQRALDYLRGQLESYGYAVIEENHDLGAFRVRNAIATREGTDPGRVIEVSAHYDTVATGPGADDNTSSVAGLLEIARVLSEVELGASVRFCFFGGEEIGMAGSTLHVQSLENYPGKVEGLLNLEMIGYTSFERGSQTSPVRIPFIVWPPREGDFICVVGNLRSGWIGNRFEGALGRYVSELPYYSVNRIDGFFGDAARSDHLPYWRAGIPALMLTDTAEFRNPNYHQASDTTETLDVSFLAAVTRACVATLLEWAELAPSSTAGNGAHEKLSSSRR